MCGIGSLKPGKKTLERMLEKEREAQLAMAWQNFFPDSPVLDRMSSPSRVPKVER